MSDYLLLLDPRHCPKCRQPKVAAHLPGQCRGCGMMLFPAESNLRQYEADTGWREYWVWTGRSEGWKHRSQIFDPQPLHRVFQQEKLPDNYGRHTTPQEIQARGGKLRLNRAA